MSGIVLAINSKEGVLYCRGQKVRGGEDRRGGETRGEQKVKNRIPIIQGHGSFWPNSSWKKRKKTTHCSLNAALADRRLGAEQGLIVQIEGT